MPLVVFAQGSGLCVARSLRFPLVIGSNVGVTAVFGGVWGYCKRERTNSLHGNLYKCVGKCQ